MRPARGFALQGRETRFDAPALMSPIGDTGLPTGRRDFADVAARETAMQRITAQTKPLTAGSTGSQERGGQRHTTVHNVRDWDFRSLHGETGGWQSGAILQPAGPPCLYLGFRADEWLLGRDGWRLPSARRDGRPGPVTTSFSPPWLA